MKKIFLTISILITIFFVLVCNYNVKKNRAVFIAKEYLQQKYYFESVYINCRFSWVDPSQYIITFSSNELLFQVFIPSNLKMPNDIIRDDYIYTYDNYILNKFKFLYLNELSDEISKSSNCFIGLKNQPIYSFKIKKDIKLSMDLNNLEKLIDYDVYINCKNVTDVVETSKNIYGYIMAINEKNFTPQNIIVCIENNKKNEFITINDWSKIGSYYEILLQLK